MSFAKNISLEINKSIILVKKCMVKRNREGSYSADEPRSRGLPAGFLDQSFYGWGARGKVTLIQPDSSGLFASALATNAKAVFISALKRAG